MYVLNQLASAIASDQEDNLSPNKYEFVQVNDTTNESNNQPKSGDSQQIIERNKITQILIQFLIWFNGTSAHMGHFSA